ncbi:hypothetical protein BJX61DRAFT_382305 [Aspergillus egyptiacus]|nr:hypothetical protein BJX61DRAFT_382305 [Aspergillus egyptiacus]
MTLRNLPLRRAILTRGTIIRNTLEGSATPCRPLATAASPGQSSNVKNPQSSSGASQSINLSRGKEARAADNADNASVQSPISAQSENSSVKHQGEEQTDTDARIKNDPRESDEKKRANVEAMGRKKLGPEDDQ